MKLIYFAYSNENSSKERKIKEKSRGCSYKIAHISVATCCTELNFVPIECIEKDILPSGI